MTTISRKTRKNLTNKRSFRIFILLCLYSVFLISCGDSSSYEQFHSIENRYWEKDAEYYFSFEIIDISIPYDLTIEIRNTNLYPYQNLWIFSREEAPSGAVTRDTTECLLADDYGKWLGTGISLFASGHPLHSQYYFREPGSYTLGFRQGMRNGRLPGIREIGLRITPSNQKTG